MLYRRLPNASAPNSIKAVNYTVHTFVVEAVNSVDTCAFVIPAQEEEILRIFDLVREEQANTFQTLHRTGTALEKHGQKSDARPHTCLPLST